MFPQPTHDDAESEAGRVEKPTAHFLQDLEAALTQERQRAEELQRDRDWWKGIATAAMASAEAAADLVDLMAKQGSQ